MEMVQEPEREPLRFDFQISDVAPEMADVMVQIKQLAEQMLFHWATFSIVLPSSITKHAENAIIFKDLFIAPNFDELDEVALDAGGKTKKLSKRQLQDVYENGEFDVPSVHFPGQVHTWRLTHLLQKGTKRAHDTLLNDAALALRLLVITAKNRFSSHFFSLTQSVKGLGTAAWQLLDILIGMPSTTPGNLEEKLQEEHNSFLVAELRIMASDRQEWTNFCDYVKEKCQQSGSERPRGTTAFRPPPVNYRFQTPKGTEIDLRLFNKNLRERCIAVTEKILERESRGWYVKFKDHIIAELKGQNLSHEEITERVNTSIMKEYIRRVFDSVLNSDELEAIQPGIGELLVQQAKCVMGMEKAVETFKSKLYKHKQELSRHLVKTYPVRSRIEPWMNEKFNEFQSEFIEQEQWSSHEEVLSVCRSQKLEQAYYFLHRDLIFMRDQEPVLRKELSRVRLPNREFSFESRIWFPRNWVVTRNVQSESRVIPTVITRGTVPFTTITANPMQPKFSVRKYQSTRTSTRYPFWRWLNYCHRTWAWTCNAMFWLGIVVPWCSPVSLRALFMRNAFIPDLQLNQIDGALCGKKSSLTQTMMSRLRLLWQHVHESREKFEASGDTGFLGKSFSRHLNRIWNYGLKGTVGSGLLVACSIPLCLAVSTLSLAAAATAPLWMPAVIVIAHLFAILVYDFDRPEKGNVFVYLFEMVFYRLLLQGCLQPIAAFLIATVCCPVAALFICIALIRRGVRAILDAAMFHLVIRKRGHVPSRDGFVARRIAGPGLASNYFYQVTPEQSLAAVESCMELHELEAWQDNMVKLIEQPKANYQQFIRNCFQPFSAVLSDHGVYRQLVLETKDLCDRLNTKVNERKKRLSTGLPSDIKAKVKVSGRELKVIISQAANMLQNVYPDHVMARLPMPDDAFWESRRLDNEDWQGLASQLLTEAFSSVFLTPLEDTDTCFRLEVKHMNLSRYTNMLKSAEFKDDLDIVSTVHTPKGDIDVDAPFLAIQIFNPVHEKVTATGMFTLRSRNSWKKPWKKTTLGVADLQKLEIPIPIAHPTVISILIHNRENDQDIISLDDVTCQRVLCAAEVLAYSEPLAPSSEEDQPTTGAGAPSTTTSVDLSSPGHDDPVTSSHLAEEEFASTSTLSGCPTSMRQSVTYRRGDLGSTSCVVEVGERGDASQGKEGVEEGVGGLGGRKLERTSSSQSC